MRKCGSSKEWSLAKPKLRWQYRLAGFNCACTHKKAENEWLSTFQIKNQSSTSIFLTKIPLQKSEFYCLWLFVHYEIECGYGPNALTDACITLMQKVNSDCAYVSLARVKKCIFKGFSQFHGYKFHISEIYQLSICSLNVCPKSQALFFISRLIYMYY